ISFTQNDVKKTGHAIEARIYAEDPETFFPSPGKITKFKAPTGNHVRNELAVESNVTVSPFYDPMIAKLVVKGSTRMEAIKEMKTALNNYYIEGIKTNIPLLKNIINNSSFIKGTATSDFINQH